MTDSQTTSITQGLSQREVLARRTAGQGNDAPLRTSRSYAQILRENVFTLINNIMFGLGIALIALGRVSDALVSVGVVLSNTLVGVVQEIRAKRTLDHIALLTRPKATVIRDGREQEVDPSELVLGDLLVLRAGDQVVVDGVLRGEGRVELDESLLTGESDLINKRAGDAVYSGSFCVSGSALYEAQKVGAQNLANQITAGARAFRRVYTPLQQQINLVMRLILLIAIYFELLLVIDGLLSNTPLVESVRMSVVIAGLVPNGLFLAIAVAYALGAVRIVGQGALVQQANAVESLSNVDVLCLDKTGTLTANRIQFDALHPLGVSDAEARRLLGDYAASTTAGNRTTQAIGAAFSGSARALREEVPFSSARKWSALLFEGEANEVYALGAPEMLRPHLTADGWQSIADEWTARGLRVLLFARGTAQTLHADGQPALPDNLAPIAVVSLSDELRPQASDTLRNFASAGIALKIISGDNPQTVAAVAQQAGFGSALRTASGLELDALDAGQMAELIDEISIFGRITPKQKEQLVQALQRRAHYVAMIGDGVNDVLSLKRANLGIAMQSGTAATRGVADIVLLDDSFAALPKAFMEGQRIINGMQDILKLFLTRVLYAAMLIASTAIIGGFPFTPKHNTILTLFTVGIPTLALAAWAKPGARARQDLLRTLLHFVLPAALMLSLAGLGVYLLYLVPTARALLAATPSLSEVAAIEGALPLAQSAITTFTIFCGLLLLPFAQPPTAFWTGGDELSGDWRPTLLAIALLAVYALILVFAPLRDFFELTLLGAGDYALLGAVAIVWALVLRWVWRTRVMDRFLGLDSDPFHTRST